ncbi:MAG: hypothetical protein JO337_01720 [Acidimicrobiales bacterium]|nr:hypothetical protein [Acidimicrobiales bacterium]
MSVDCEVIDRPPRPAIPNYHAGVLTLIMPVREAAKPRKRAVTTSDADKQLASA